MRALIVEDELKMASLIRRGLREDGIVADVAVRAEDALWMVAESRYDAIVLDVMLPGVDGFDLCQQLRARKVATPILFLTARDGVDDRVRGLNLGADDYLAKPFSFPELIARLRVLARRRNEKTATVLEAGDLRLDPYTRRAWRGDVELELSAREFAVLTALIEHPGQVLDRIQILERAWDQDFEHRSNVVDVYIRYVREKVDRPFGLSSIETVRGAGYRLRADGGRSES